MDFRLRSVPLLSRVGADRAGDLQADRQAVAPSPAGGGEWHRHRWLSGDVERRAVGGKGGGTHHAAFEVVLGAHAVSDEWRRLSHRRGQQQVEAGAAIERFPPRRDPA